MFKRTAYQLISLVSLAVSLLNGATVTVRSGNGTVGGRDSAITFLQGPANTDFSHPFTSTDFSSAQSGPAAFIMSRNPVWISGLSVDSAAKWIGTNTNAGCCQGNTALYAVGFTIPTAFSSATLSLNYAVDDGLGTTNPGLYLNGTAICSNLITYVNDFTQEHVLNCPAVGPLLHVGMNWLYFDGVNAAGPAALLFSATITTTDIPQAVSASPSALSFTANMGTNPAPRALQVSGSAGSPSFSAQASSAGWLSVSPTSGITPANVQASVNSANLSAGTYSGTILVFGTGGATGQTTVNVSLTVVAPFPTITKVTNTASFASGSISPGEAIAIFGSAFGPVNGVSQVAAEDGKVATSLGGVQVMFLKSGVAAPIIYASSTQVNAVVPYEAAGAATADVEIMYQGRSSNVVSLNVLPATPGLFTLDSSGSGAGAILDSQYNVVGQSNPVSQGDVIQIYCTGLGTVSNQPGTGSPAPSSPLAETTPKATVAIAGVPAQVFYSGLAPGSVGLCQVNAQIPTGIATGPAVPVVVSVGGVASNTVTVAIQPFPPPPNPQPLVTGLSPSSATAGTSSLALTINGSGFIASTTVTFNGALHSPSLVNSGQLTITLTASDLATAGTFAVVVSNPLPGGGNSKPVNFTVSAAPNPKPTITSLSPLSATVGAGSSVLTINGSGFISSSSATFNGAIHSASLVSSNQLTITLGAADLSTAGTFAVVVTNPSPGGGASNSVAFSVLFNGLTGNWSGAWGSIPSGALGLMSAKLAQTGSTLTGSISLDSICFPGGPFSGTVSDTIDGTITISGIQLAALKGQVTSDGKTINGAYLVTFGSCNGDYGIFTLSRSK
jgi:uncharacterized protein (TIGR03437 family)